MSVKIDQYWVKLIRLRPAQADQWSKMTGAVRSGFLMMAVLLKDKCLAYAAEDS